MKRTPRFELFRVSCLGLALVIGGILTGSAVAEDREDARTVKVERVKPKREKKPTLQFLRANVSFLRSRIDALREVAVERSKEGDELDPRYLAFIDLLEARSQDEAALVGIAVSESLMASIGDLTEIEARLQELGRILDAQEARLSHLHEDYVGHQETSLVVLLDRLPDDATVVAVTLRFEDGVEVRIPVGPQAQLALEGRGLLQLYHDYVEPRSQWLEILVSSSEVPGVSGYVQLRPSRDRLNFLELDLASFEPGQGPETMTARTWAQTLDAGTTTQEAWSW